MNCPHCGTSAPEGAKFCMECGGKLGLACSSCGVELPPAAKFCLECGTKVGEPSQPAAQAAREVESAGSPVPGDALERYIPRELLARLQSARSDGKMRGERRVVTMLFCDVQGSTAAAERLDPEEWADIMNGAFGHLIAPVYRYEGTLARLMGDAILAFFGAPITHEDDPQRAVLAGLAIVDAVHPYRERIKREWGIEFDVRVGINTGLVVVGEVGSDMRLEYTAMGDEVNLAARMEQTASPGTVQISENTYRLVAPLFEVEGRGPIQVKGKSEPVETYRVLRPKTEPGRLRGVAGIDSPMVGRGPELNILRDRIDALRRGVGNTVSIMGEAGLGKSRLVAELRQEVLADDETVRWVEGRSLSYQTKTPYAPVKAILRDLLELGEEISEAAADSLRQRLRSMLGDRAPAVFPPLASLLGLPLEDDEFDRIQYMEPPILQAARRDAAAEYIEALAERGPLVVVFEDLHWADSASLAVASGLVSVAERSGLLLLALLRPRRDDAAWTFHEDAQRDFPHRYASLWLRPLDESQARELVRNLLRIEGIPDSLREEILAKADGNPFFVEEVIRSLIDEGALAREDDVWRATREIDAISVPDNLATLLNARLDALPDGSKRVAQTAAVLGRTFDYDTLASVYEPLDEVERALKVLQRRGLIREKSKRPVRRYTFKHALTQSAAYESLLMRDRRAMHGRVADALVRIAPDHATEIAEHYVAARDRVKALPWLVEAGEQSAKAYAADESIDLFTQALEILQAGVADTALARRAFEGRGNMFQMAGRMREAFENFHAMNEYAVTHGDGSMEVSAMNKAGFTHALCGEFEKAAQHFDQAEDRSVEVDCPPGRAELSMYRCFIHMGVGEFEAAQESLARASELGRQLEAEEPRLFGLVHIANTYVSMTDFDGAWAAIEEARAEAERFGNKKWLSELLTFAIPMVHMRNGNGQEMMEALDEGVELAEEIQHHYALCNGAVTLGNVAAMTGRFEDAIRWEERAVEAGGKTGFAMMESMALCTLGTTYLAVSEELHSRAVELHHRGLGMLQGAFASSFGGVVWCEVGFCALKMGKVDEAGELFERGLTQPTAPMRLVKPRLHMGAGLVALHQGDVDRARREVAAGRAFAEECGMQHFYPFLSMAEGHVEHSAGDFEQALGRFDDAIDMMERGGLLPSLWETLAASAGTLEELGRVDDAAGRRERARQTIHQIGEVFEDQELRGQYVTESLRQV